jgi:hypothetical protein
MNLRMYFQKIREAEASIVDEVVHVVSLETDDGGIEGIMTEVPKALAARLLVDQRSRLATPEEKAAHLDKQHAMRKKIQDDFAAQRLQVAIVSDLDLANFRRDGKTSGGDGKKG